MAYTHRFYISGGITNVPDYKERFTHAEMRLRERFPEAEIINPTMIVLPKSCKHEDYMRIDLMLLDLADCIYLLSNWEKSKGACIEYGYAQAKEKMIFFESKGDCYE